MSVVEEMVDRSVEKDCAAVVDVVVVVEDGE